MSLTLALLALLGHAAVLGHSASCGCGYVVSTTSVSSQDNSTTSHVFTEAMETDFLHVYTLPTYSNATIARMDAFGWQAQAYNITPVEARGPYGEAAEVDNVVVNPLPSTSDWGGEGINGGDPGLQLWVRSENDLLNISTNDSSLLAVRTSEMDTIRQDILYGSFRVGMKMTTVNGTCGAFFWFRNNTAELDMEYLSGQQDTSDASVPAVLNLVMQTPLSAAAGYNAAGTPYYLVEPLSFDPGADYHEYRFDWVPDLVTFYIDGTPVWSIADSDYVPNEAGHFILNHWSNGNPLWSGGPPDQDTQMTVSYVKLYFNSSNPALQTDFDGNCTSQAESCAVMEPNFGQGISPIGSNGNVTGKTPFLTNDTGWDAANNESAGSPGRRRSVMLEAVTVVQCLVSFYWLL